MKKPRKINSRNKGKVGELELSNLLKSRGYDTHRGQQYKGGGDSPDVVGVPGFHIECKRVEAGNLYKWMEQAKRDASYDAMPVVIHRRNGKPWVAILDLDDFIHLIKVHTA